MTFVPVRDLDNLQVRHLFRTPLACMPFAYDSVADLHICTMGARRPNGRKVQAFIHKRPGQSSPIVAQFPVHQMEEAITRANRIMDESRRASGCSG